MNLLAWLRFITLSVYVSNRSLAEISVIMESEISRTMCGVHGWG